MLSLGLPSFLGPAEGSESRLRFRHLSGLRYSDLAQDLSGYDVRVTAVELCCLLPVVSWADDEIVA